MVFKKRSVTERLKRLEEVLEKLKKKANVTLEDYQRNTELQWMIERGLELASSAILDIGNHILAGMYGISVDEYEEILEKLCEKAVISAALYQELRGLGGFRNILVHGYLKLNPELVYKHFKKAVSTFPKFIAEIENWLEKQGGS